MRIPDRFLTPDGDTVNVGPLVASFALEDVLAISALDKKGEFHVSIVAADREDEHSKVKSKHFDSLP
jgi:hypothetical protein